MDTTADDAHRSPGDTRADGRAAAPGLVVLSEAGRPVSRVLPVPRGGLLLGRGQPNGCFADDELVSRSHLQARRVAGCWTFEDRGSRNGSRLNGAPLEHAQTLASPVVVRLGRSLCWAVEDISDHLEGPVLTENGGPILGAALRRVWREIAVASHASDTLLIGGPSGAGKELAARAYHRAAHAERAAGAPFVAVNCATIPQGLAERLLFGAKRGAYSGAVQDADGFVQAAHGGTLFLDEVAELDPAVQAKLLRVLEAREVTPLGASQAVPVNLRVCAATLRDLRGEVACGRFREDLYYRLGRPVVIVPPLSQRLDELPFLVARALSAVDPRLCPATDLIEQCALRPWPGNVRELVGELRHAGVAALHADTTLVEARFLASDAGQPLATSSSPPTPAAGPESPTSASHLSDEVIRAALQREGNNVSAAARALGLHRNQLRRWLDRQG